MLKDICLPYADIPLEEIVNAGGLKEFIEEYVESGKPFPLSALQIFNRGKLQGLSEAIRLLRSIKVFDVELYFITPIGLLWEDEPLIPYKGCLDALQIDAVRRLFTMFNVNDAIYDILETQSDFLYLYVNTKILKLLKLIDYIPKQTISLIVSDTGLSIKRKHIRPVYPSTHLLLVFKKYGLKITHENFPGMFLLHFARFLFRLSFEMGSDKFMDYLLKIKNSPDDFLDIVTSPEILCYAERARDQSLLKFIRGERNNE